MTREAMKVFKNAVRAHEKESLIAMDDWLAETKEMRSTERKVYAGRGVCPSRVSRGFLARVGVIAGVPAANGRRHRWHADQYRQTISYSRSESHGPNQSLEPTTTAVTIPAAQEVAPAVVVAHL